MLHRSLLFAATACLLITGGCSRRLPPGERNNFHAFGVDHASLHLEYFGEARGTEDLYEDSSGIREAHFVHYEIAGGDQFHPTITYTLRNLSTVMIVDSVKVTEVHLLDKTSDSLYHLPPSDVPSPSDQFGSFLKQRGYKYAGDTTILASGMSLKSHIWQLGINSSFVYEFKGLVVGKRTTIAGHENDLRLTSIDTVSPIDPAVFVVHHGFPVMDMTKDGPEMPGSQP